MAMYGVPDQERFRGDGRGREQLAREMKSYRAGCRLAHPKRVLPEVCRRATCMRSGRRSAVHRGTADAVGPCCGLEPPQTFVRSCPPRARRDGRYRLAGSKREDRRKGRVLCKPGGKRRCSVRALPAGARDVAGRSESPGAHLRCAFSLCGGRGFARFPCQFGRR